MRSCRIRGSAEVGPGERPGPPPAAGSSEADAAFSPPSGSQLGGLTAVVQLVPPALPLSLPSPRPEYSLSPIPSGNQHWQSLIPRFLSNPTSSIRHFYKRKKDKRFKMWSSLFIFVSHAFVPSTTNNISVKFVMNVRIMFIE